MNTTLSEPIKKFSKTEIENKFYFTMRDVNMELNADSIKTFKK